MRYLDNSNFARISQRSVDFRSLNFMIAPDHRITGRSDRVN